MKTSNGGRTDKAINNGIWSSVAYIFTVLLGMYCQRLFILEFGYDLYGLNAMFTTIVSTLGVTELGVGTAIVFSLYKPLSEHNERKISALVSLYRKVYGAIGGIILAGCCALIPFIPSLTGFQIKVFMLPYLIFVINASFSYLFTFNQTILNADQKNYIVSITTCTSRSLYNLLQILIIYTTGNFILYTLANMACTVGSNLILNRLVAKQYPFLRKYREEKLSEVETVQIKNKFWALIYHKIGGYLVSGGDNFILSGILGVATVGYYANYTFITNTLKSLIGSILAGFMSGFGNLIATESSERNIQVFRRARFIYFVLYLVSSVGMFCCIEPFLSFLYTEQTILPHTVLWLITLNYFIYGYSACFGDYRAAAGVFEPDRFLSILIPMLNVAISISLVYVMGVAGILFGTFICYAIKECTAVPYICSKYMFHCRPHHFLGRLWADTAFAMLCCAVAQFICGTVAVRSSAIRFFINGMIGVAFSFGMIILFYGRSDEFHFMMNTLRGKINRKVHKGV